MKRVMCYGDSNTWGYNPHDVNPVSKAVGRYPEHVRWTSVMEDELGVGYKVYEQGYCGRTTVFDDPLGAGRNGLKHLEVVFKSCEPVDMVIIMLGTNDQKDMFGTSAYVIAEGLNRMVCELKVMMADSNSPDARIMLVSPLRLSACADGSFTYGFSQKSVDMSDELRDRIKSLADASGCEFFDAAALVKADPLDGTHIMADGHKALGKAMAEKVKQVLG